MNNWLNEALVYEIYPQSFYDTNGDGIGDLQGIIEKLDYIEACGFNTIWLHPINKSSFMDAGYDVTDYYQVDPRYGTNDDFKELCKLLHERNMKIIFDLVTGHTSIDHPWFQAALKAEKNEYSNRYIWVEGDTIGGNEGFASLGERAGAYIPNCFWFQPSLNYGYAHPDPEKPWQMPITHPDCIATKKEMLNIMDFWMDMGVDAFRVDMAAHFIKGETDGKCISAFWNEVRSHVEAKNPECLLISEWGEPHKAIDAGFHCDFLLQDEELYTTLFRHEAGRNTHCQWVGHSYFNKDGKGNINSYLDGFWENYNKIGDRGVIGMVTGNHDMPRISYQRTQEEIQVAMAFLFTMPGVPFVYYGDEIGMRYMKGIPSKEGGYQRTGSRTPMQWNGEKNHGFSESDTPYLATDQSEDAPTVEKQINDRNSLLSFVKKLVAIRKKCSALSPMAEFEVLMPGYPFVYERKDEKQTLFVAINPSGYKHYYDMPEMKNVIFSQNIRIEGNRLFMNGVSFIIAEEK